MKGKKQNIVLPNYKDGSIVNLMSSIIHSFNGKSKYADLKLLKSTQLKNKNIILLVIDGLGYEYLKERSDSFLLENCRGKITTVFPATTAAAIPVFNTGVAPKQTALLGWNMFFKEIGTYCEVFLLNDDTFDYSQIFVEKTVAQRINAKSYTLVPRGFNSKYNDYYNKGFAKKEYTSFENMLNKIKKISAEHKKRKFIYAYWPYLDGTLHRFGMKSKKAKNHLNNIDGKIKKFSKWAMENNFTIIVTADHGLTDINKTITLNDYKDIVDCLSMPASGDARARYCFIRPNKTKEFEKLVKKHLSKFCDMCRSTDLIKKNYFGLYEESKKLKERIGDYTLIAKNNYELKYLIPGKKQKKFVAHHSGMTKEEMYVPLIVIDSNKLKTTKLHYPSFEKIRIIKNKK